jgi:hypothetical protein
MTRAELLEVVSRFYPRGLPEYDPAYDNTEEHRRLVDAARRARAEYPTWKAMIGRLGARYGLQNESLFLLSGGVDPAYSARIYIPRETISFHVCCLGPYYGIHHTGEADEAPAAIAQEIEATYPGYEPIPPEIGNEVVPDVSAEPRLFGEATIYVCLLSTVWELGGVRGPVPCALTEVRDGSGSEETFPDAEESRPASGKGRPPW